MKNSKFDMRPVSWRDRDGVLLVDSCLQLGSSKFPIRLFLSSTSLCCKAGCSWCRALQDMIETGALFALLICCTKVIGLAGPGKASLHPNDILLLPNFISSSDSFRTSKSFSPVCLPRYNTSAFLYAYVQYLDKDACLILLSEDSGNFFTLKECRARIEVALRESEVLRAMKNVVLKSGLRVEKLLEAGPLSTYGAQTGTHRISNLGNDSVIGIRGPAGLWHFLYRSSYLDQYVASDLSPPLHTRVAQKTLNRAYKKLHASMHDKGAAGAHKMQYRKDGDHVLLSWRT